MSGVDQIMRLADEWYAHGQTSHSGIDEKYAALRAAVEQVIAENLQRGNVIGRITAHLLGNKNNVTDEDVVIAAAEVGRELQGARERAERAEADYEDARVYVTEYAKCAVRDALELALSAVVMRGRADPSDVIRALLKEYSDE